MEQDKLQEAKFMAKEQEQLTTNTPIKFNSSIIKLQTDRITLTQERQCKNLEMISTKPSDSMSSRGVLHTALTPKDQYIAQCTRGAYIMSVCQPEASFNLSFTMQTINPVEEDVKNLNK